MSLHCQWNKCVNEYWSTSGLGSVKNRSHGVLHQHVSREQPFHYITVYGLFCSVVKSFILRKHSPSHTLNTSSVVENQPCSYISIIFCLQSSINCKRWKMEVRFFHMGLGAPFRDVNKLLKFCDWNWNLSSCPTVNLNIDLPIPLSSHQPYCSINRQDVRLKSSPISPQGLIGAEGQETCMFLLVYCLYGSNKSGECVCVQAMERFPSCVLLPFPFQNLLFLFFMISPKQIQISVIFK